MRDTARCGAWTRLADGMAAVAAIRERAGGKPRVLTGGANRFDLFLSQSIENDPRTRSLPYLLRQDRERRQRQQEDHEHEGADQIEPAEVVPESIEGGLGHLSKAVGGGGANGHQDGHQAGAGSAWHEPHI